MHRSNIDNRFKSEESNRYSIDQDINLYSKLPDEDVQHDSISLKNKINIDENLMNGLNKDMLGEKGSIIMSKPTKNYINYNLDNDKSRECNNIKTKILRSRLKRYNDTNEHNLEEIYDVL